MLCDVRTGVVLVAALIVAAIVGSAAAAEGDRLSGASSDDHLWFVADRRADLGTVELRQHAQVMTGPWLGARVPIPSPPEALAAWSNALWIAFGAKSEEAGREVFKVTVHREPVLSAWIALPRNHMEIMPAMPPGGAIGGFVGTRRGPVVLLRAPGDEPGARLLRLEAGGWNELHGWDDVTGAHVAAGGDDGSLLHCILGVADGSARLETVTTEGARLGGPIGVPFDAVRSMTRAGGQAVAVLDDAAGGPRLSFVRRSALLEIAGFDRPDRPWIALGLRDGVRIAAYAEGEGTLQRISTWSGEVGPAEAMASQPTEGLNLLKVPALLAVTIIATVLAVIFRPGERGNIQLASGLAVLPPSARIVALLIDMVPPSIVALLLLGDRPADLLQMPLMAVDLADTGSFSLAAALCVAVSTVSEIVWGRTLGKAALGARVCAPDGTRVSWSRVLVRNVLKLVVLLVFPLAVFNLVSPNLQGLPDLVGRTVVVRRVVGDAARAKRS